MLTREEHERLSLRVQFSRFWVEHVANVNDEQDRCSIILMYWEVLEITKMLHPERILA
jgi:hypothetical protein